MDTKKETGIVVLTQEVEGKIVTLRKQQVIADADVAVLFGVKTQRVNEAVRNNVDKFPADYLFELSDSELRILRSKISTTNVSSKSRNATKVFTEKGLYMLATILKSKRATAVTFAIIETFAKVRSLKRELIELHKGTSIGDQETRINHFGEVLSDLVMPDLTTTETESTLELNFVVGKIKHTVKRVKKDSLLVARVRFPAFPALAVFNKRNRSLVFARGRFS